MYDKEKDIRETDFCIFTEALAECTKDKILTYRNEIRSDNRFVKEIEQKLSQTRTRPKRLHNNYREILYVLVRANKPCCVIETGVYDGLGSAYILNAIAKNGKGKLYSIDKNDPSTFPRDLPGAQCGWIVPDYLKHWWEFIEGDVFEILPSILLKNDVRLYCSDTSDKRCMDFELQLCNEHLRTGCVILRIDSETVDMSKYIESRCQAVSMSRGKVGMLSGIRKVV